MRTAVAAVFVLMSSVAGAAAQTGASSVDFDGGKLIIADGTGGMQTLTLDGRELASADSLQFERAFDVAGVKAAYLTAYADSTTPCSRYGVMVVRRGGEPRADVVEAEECRLAEPILDGNRVLFVPSPAPGRSLPVVSWSPEKGVLPAGEKAFEPKAGTGWADIETARIAHPYGFFDNADVYQAAHDLLGNSFDGMITGLAVSMAEPGRTGTGVLYAGGCVSRACPAWDAFVAVDAKARKLYFAERQSVGAPKTWPDLGEWPAELAGIMKDGML